MVEYYFQIAEDVRSKEIGTFLSGPDFNLVNAEIVEGKNVETIVEGDEVTWVEGDEVNEYIAFVNYRKEREEFPLLVKTRWNKDVRNGDGEISNKVIEKLRKVKAASGAEKVVVGYDFNTGQYGAPVNLD
jgi:hypothetical protein